MMIGWVVDGTRAHAADGITINDNVVIAGTVTGVAKSMVGLGSVGITSDALEPIRKATQTARDSKAPLANPTFTGTVAGVTNSMVGLVRMDHTSNVSKPVSS